MTRGRPPSRDERAALRGDHAAALRWHESHPYGPDRERRPRGKRLTSLVVETSSGRTIRFDSAFDSDDDGNVWVMFASEIVQFLGPIGGDVNVYSTWFVDIEALTVSPSHTWIQDADTNSELRRLPWTEQARGVERDMRPDVERWLPDNADALFGMCISKVANDVEHAEKRVADARRELLRLEGLLAADVIAEIRMRSSSGTWRVQ